ncbi:MAG: phenylalanine--tRNA ligase subunit beta [Bacteroidales bacterium]|nr:phenylalanine--tRNA ligase subunit beta [Bacteroidales bacterium]
MKISYKWLKDYLNFDLSPADLSLLMTNCGLEVERMEEWESVKGGLKGVVIGEVISCRTHPDADRLSLTQVNVGSGEPLEIVCGAPNVAAGQKVVVALPGAVLYQGDTSFEIKKTKIRGAWSSGMICAEDEVGLGDSHAGIMVLAPEAVPGTPAAEWFGVDRDIVFEIGLTPNRTDAISHIGVARDIRAALDARAFLQGEEISLEFRLPDVNAFRPDNEEQVITVEVMDPDLCPRYTGLTITGIQVGESPRWLKNRLLAIGQRPINNIVDITNFVLHETGQPLHAFDASHIPDNRVIVRRLHPGTLFTTLDGIERTLEGDELMICNTREGMCIGGVFGGIFSGVVEQTTSVFLESACFHPASIRRTSKRHDLQTEASFRFERGVDPEMTLYALKRAALLIREIAGGTISSPIQDVFPSVKPGKVIHTNQERIESLIGKKIGRPVTLRILKSLDFEVTEKIEGTYSLKPPGYRVEVTREADVIEEILRIYGYDRVEIPGKLTSSLSHPEKPGRHQIQVKISEYLTGNGFYEIMNNSLTRNSYFENNPDFPDHVSVRILNPLSRDLGTMRQTMLYGGLETILFNINRKAADLKLFEFGNVYMKEAGAPSDGKVTERFSEQFRLDILMTGRRYRESWYCGDETVDFFQLKAFVVNVLKLMGFSDSRLTLEPVSRGYLESGQVARSGDSDVFELGKVNQELLRKMDIRQDVYYASFDWDYIMKHLDRKTIRFSEIPRFPEVRRDLALLLDRQVRYEDIERIAMETGIKNLREVNLFDVYEGEGLEPEKKSYAVSFILRDAEKTLTDHEIDRIMERLIEALTRRLNARIR